MEPTRSGPAGAQNGMTNDEARMTKEPLNPNHHEPRLDILF
jgi:hypothetical protein